jgi:hypothetical protein
VLVGTGVSVGERVGAGLGGSVGRSVGANPEMGVGGRVGAGLGGSVGRSVGADSATGVGSDPPPGGINPTIRRNPTTSTIAITPMPSQTMRALLAGSGSTGCVGGMTGGGTGFWLDDGDATGETDG